MKKDSNDPEKGRDEIIAKLVHECISTHNELILIHLILRLETNYIELATLSTLGAYRKSWTHEDVMNHLTYEQSE